MPVGIIQPSNQIKITNVSVVRMKKNKKRFEIACYKNKVLEWRNKIEKDVSNVLQVPDTVFVNVSKGQVAPKADLDKAWPGQKRDDIIKDILDHGELQVGEQERQEQLERIHHEVIDIVTNKLVDSKTKRMYTSGMIEKALDQLSSQAAHLPQVEKSEGANVENGEEKEKAKPKWTGVVATKSAKSQALFAMKALIAHQPLPVMRARMKLRVICPMQVLKHNVKLAPKAQDAGQTGDSTPKAKGTVKDFILGFVEQVETEDTAGDKWEVVGFVEPGLYKELTAFVETQTKGRARVEVLDMAVVHEDD